MGAGNPFGNPFGNSFAMLAMLPTLLEEEAEPVAAVITRSNKAAAGSTAAAPRQSMPKSFLPPGPLPVDPNSSQARHTSAVDINLDTAAPIEYKMESTKPKDFTKTARLLQELREELKNCESTAVHASTLHALDGLIDKHRGWSKLQSHSQVAWPAQAAAAAFDIYKHSASSSSSLLGNVGESLGSLPCSSNSDTSGFTNRVHYMFQPQFGELGVKDLSRISLDKIRAVSKEDGITITLPDGRECLMEDVIVDSGSNTLLITDAYCKELGLHVNRDIDLPGLKGIDGKLAPYLVGRTPPFSLTLGKGSHYPAKLHVSAGSLVMKGNA